MTKIKGAQAFIESLKRENVDVIFGIPGGYIIDVYDQLYDSGTLSQLSSSWGGVNNSGVADAILYTDNTGGHLNMPVIEPWPWLYDYWNTYHYYYPSQTITIKEDTTKQAMKIAKMLLERK